MSKREIEKPADPSYQLKRQLEALTLASRHLMEAAQADEQRAEAIEKCQKAISAQQSLSSTEDNLDIWFTKLPDAPTARILQRLFRETRQVQRPEHAWRAVNDRAMELMKNAQDRAARTKAEAEHAESHRLAVVEQLKTADSTTPPIN